MLIKTSNRREAYTALINQLLQDPTRYCNNCGTPFRPGMPRCCDEPEIGTNADVAMAVADQCRMYRETAKSDYACGQTKALRFGISLPVFIYQALDNYEKKHGRKLIRSDKDIIWLARNFPQFRIPRTL